MPSTLISLHNPSKNNTAYLCLWFGFPQPVTSDKCDVHKKRTTSHRGKKQLKRSPWVQPWLPLWGGRGSICLRFHRAESGAGVGVGMASCSLPSQLSSQFLPSPLWYGDDGLHLSGLLLKSDFKKLAIMAIICHRPFSWVVVFTATCFTLTWGSY